MLLNFINGKSKVLTGEMLLDLFTAEFRNTLDVEDISIKANSYTVDFRENNPHRYGICPCDSYTKHGYKWIFFVDENAKIIITNTHYLLNEFNNIVSVDGIGKCVNKLGDYNVIELSAFVNEINELFSKIDEEVIVEQKVVLLNKIGKLVEKKKLSQKAQDMKFKMQLNIRRCYEYYFISNEPPKPPKILDRIDKNESVYYVANNILYYLLDKESFTKDAKILCKKNIEEKSSMVYEYFEILKRLSIEETDKELLTCRKVLDSVKDITEDVNIITVEGKRIKMSTDYSDGFFNNSAFTSSIHPTDIKTIFYNRKTIYQKNE